MSRSQVSNWQADLEMAVRFVVDKTVDGEPLWTAIATEVSSDPFRHWYPSLLSPTLFKQDRLALWCNWRMYRAYPSPWPRSQETLFTLKVASLLAQRYPDRGMIIKPVIYVRSRPELEPFLDARSPVAARRKHNKIMRGRNP